MKNRLFVTALAAAILLCGCSSAASETTPVYGSQSLISSPAESSSKTVSESTESSSSQSSSSVFSSSSSTASVEYSSSTPDYSQIPFINASLTDEERRFTEQSLFIGDSICLGLAVFDVLKAENVLGMGNTGARNIFKASFYRKGKDLDFLSVIREEKPKHVIFWMGMNDVNMTGSAEYCENYRKIIEKVLELPETDVFVLSISPICSDFTPNSRIVEFNSALSDYITASFPERVRFVNIHDALQNENGELQWYFSSGDGVHLNDIAYYTMLHAFFGQVDITQENEPVQPSSSSSSTESSSSSETTASTESSSSSEENSSSQSSETTATESTSAAVLFMNISC